MSSGDACMGEGGRRGFRRLVLTSSSTHLGRRTWRHIAAGRVAGILLPSHLLHPRSSFLACQIQNVVACAQSHIRAAWGMVAAQANQPRPEAPRDSLRAPVFIRGESVVQSSVLKRVVLQEQCERKKYRGRRDADRENRKLPSGTRSGAAHLCDVMKNMRFLEQQEELHRFLARSSNIVLDGHVDRLAAH